MVARCVGGPACASTRKTCTLLSASPAMHAHHVSMCCQNAYAVRDNTKCIEPCGRYWVESGRGPSFTKGTKCLAWKDGKPREDTCYEDQPLCQAFMSHACDPVRGLREGHPMHVSSCEACCTPGMHFQLPYSQLISAAHKTSDTHKNYTVSLPVASETRV